MTHRRSFAQSPLSVLLKQDAAQKIAPHDWNAVGAFLAQSTAQWGAIQWQQINDHDMRSLLLHLHKKWKEQVTPSPPKSMDHAMLLKALAQCLEYDNDANIEKVMSVFHKNELERMMLPHMYEGDDDYSFGGKEFSDMLPMEKILFGFMKHITPTPLALGAFWGAQQTESLSAKTPLFNKIVMPWLKACIQKVAASPTSHPQVQEGVHLWADPPHSTLWSHLHREAAQAGNHTVVCLALEKISACNPTGFAHELQFLFNQPCTPSLCAVWKDLLQHPRILPHIPAVELLGKMIAVPQSSSVLELLLPHIATLPKASEKLAQLNRQNCDPKNAFKMLKHQKFPPALIADFVASFLLFNSHSCQSDVLQSLASTINTDDLFQALAEFGSKTHHRDFHDACATVDDLLSNLTTPQAQEGMAAFLASAIRVKAPLMASLLQSQAIHTAINTAPPAPKKKKM